MHPVERLSLTLGIAQYHIYPEGVMSFAIGHRGNRHDLADDRLGGVAATGHRRRHVFDGKATGHDLHRSQVSGGRRGETKAPSGRSSPHGGTANGGVPLFSTY